MDIGRDMVTFCSVVGKDVAKVVKKLYLFRNDHYLLRVVAFRTLQPAREKATDWMDCNEGYWQMKCLGRKANANLYTVTLSEEAALSIQLKRANFYVCCDMWNFVDEWPSNRSRTTSFFLEIGGVDVSNMSVQESTDLLHACSENVREDGKVKFSCIDTLSVLLSHPVVMARFGLLRVVKHLIEEKLVDPNAVYPSGCHDDPLSDDTLWLPLLAHSYSTSDLSALKYLLTVKDINVNAQIRGHCHLYFLARFNFVPCEMLARFLENPLVNRNARDQYGRTVIHLLVENFNYWFAEIEGTEIPHTLMIEKLGCLLEAGVDPMIRDNDGRTAEQYLDIFGSLANDIEVEARRKEYLREIGGVRDLIKKFTNHD